jgi:hypothetical protein
MVKAQRDLSALTGEERIRILHHIGTEPLPNDQYGYFPSVIEHLSPDWNHKESILNHPNVDDKTFKFPVVNQRALFVRKCYHELYKIITNSSTADGWVRILLTGTSGIGKSTFLVYFIIRHLYEPRIQDVLIFQPARSNDEFYAFAGPNIVRKGTYSDFEAFFLLPTTWYLVDWKPKSGPISMPAATLFALSPNSIRDREFQDFEKVLDVNLCMPVWTYDELEECRRHVFQRLPNRSLKYIHNRVGGVPRSCLEAPTKALRRGYSEDKAREKGLRRLQDAFNGIEDPLKVLRAQEESLGSVQVSGRLLHKVPDSKTYQDGRHRVWASAYVIDRFVNMMNTYEASDMKREVREGLANNERDGTLGKVFECYVRHLFFTGGGVGLRKRRLYKASKKGKKPEPKPEPEQWFTIPNDLEHKPFSGMVDFSIPEGDIGTIWTPGPNFPSVDIILTPNSLFQVTISTDHPVKQEPLRKILEKLPAGENISLYFVVPERHFESFTFQNYHNEQGKVSGSVPPPVGALEQWVLGVPLEGFLSGENAEQSEVRGMKKRAANEDDMRQSQTPGKRKRNILVSNAEMEVTNKKGNRRSQRLRSLDT